MKRLMTVAAAAVVACGIVATTAQAKPDDPKANNVAAKICQAEKHADPATFQATYADDGRHAMRNCMRAHRGEATEIIQNAAQQCQAEQDADPVLFQETYGTNGNGNGNGNGSGKNAFGKCVSQKVHEQLAAVA